MHSLRGVLSDFIKEALAAGLMESAGDLRSDSAGDGVRVCGLMPLALSGAEWQSTVATPDGGPHRWSGLCYRADPTGPVSALLPGASPQDHVE